MLHKFSSTLPAFVAMLFSCMSGSLAADGNPPPAGQMCPQGAYVIGFDAGGNIVCSAASGGSAIAPATAQQEEDEADVECPADCPSQTPDAVVAGGSADTANVPGAQGAGAGPVISRIKPAWVVFGARETTILIKGEGFTAGSVVKFQGADYTPSVNSNGTELRVTLATADLAMGRYPITVADGAGVETTRPRALEVF
jgi:hypothetical protein